MELIDYVNPQDTLPTLKGAGTLLVIGSAACVWDDLRRYDQQHGVQARCAINDMIYYYPGRLQFGASLHTNKLYPWIYGQALRQIKGGWPPMRIHSNRPDLDVDYAWRMRRDGGTSGLFMVFVGLLMDYDRVVLAGIPCDDSPRFFDDPQQKHKQFGLTTCHQEWERARDEVPIFKERVRSLSGNTQKWLGAPE